LKTDILKILPKGKGFNFSQYLFPADFADFRGTEKNNLRLLRDLRELKDSI